MSKKLQQVACLIGASVLFASCYTTRTYVGNVHENDPVVKVNQKTNNFLLWGLVPLGGATLQNNDFVSGHKDYVVEKQQSFVNGFLNVITAGIYSPMTTSYYIPAK